MSQSQRVERRLAAIFAADVAGYSRLMSLDEVGTLRSLTAHREILYKLIAEHGGRIANTAGDSVLAEFPSAVDAVQCAIAVQYALRKENEATLRDERLLFRIGVHVGDVMVKGGDLLGDGVNIAARLQGIAEPGGICVSGDAYRHVRKALTAHFADLGPQTVKNIGEPIRAYTVSLGQAAGEEAGRLERPKPMPLPDKPSVAVLPFVNLSGDSEQDYFADGVTEEVTTALARMRWLFVIARNSAFAFRGHDVDAREIGRKLGVRYVLEGTIRRSANRIRITGHLVEAELGVQLWNDRFDGSAEDVFELQDRVAESVAAAIEPRLRGAEIERATRKRPDDLTAYDRFLRALFHFYEASREEIEEALRLLREAMVIDPSYAPPFALASQCHVYNIVQGWSEDVARDMQEGARLAYAAVERDRDDPTVLWMAGHSIGRFTSDHEASLNLLAKAIKLNPSSASAWCWSGWGHLYAEDWRTAIEHLRVALRLSPIDPKIFLFQSGLGLAYAQGEQYEDAIRWARASISEQPKWLAGHRVLIASLALLGRTVETGEAARVFLTYDPNFQVSQFSALSVRLGPRTKRFLEGLRLAGLPE